MKTLLIFNPVAGANRRDRRLGELLQAFVRRRDADAALVTTRHPGHATELAAQAAESGCAVVAAVGGDGTAHEVAIGLLGKDTALGFVPRGSGNGLARHLGVPLDPARALARLAEPADLSGWIDTGVIAGRPFINAAGCGFDAELARRFQASKRRGLRTYLALGWDLWRESRAEHYEIEAGTERFAVEAQIVACANSAQYGNGALIAPGAAVDDGQLDLVCLAPQGLLATLRVALQVFTGSLRGNPDARFRTGQEFVITRRQPGWIHTDGEPHWAPAQLPVQVRARSLKVLLPLGRGFSAPAALAAPAARHPVAPA